jgi:hypothetical protein
LLETAVREIITGLRCRKILKKVHKSTIVKSIKTIFGGFSTNCDLLQLKHQLKEGLFS